MERYRPLQLVSTESVGVFGTADHVAEVNAYGFEQGIVDGVELMAFRPSWRLQMMIEGLAKRNIGIDHLHGRTGGNGRDIIDTLKLRLVANPALVPSSYLIETTPQEIGVLFHHPEASKSELQKTILNSTQGQKIWVENHHGDHAVPDMVNLVLAMRNHSIPAAGMFDVCHYLGAENLKDMKLFPKAYEQMLGYLDELLERKDSQGNYIIDGFHIPTGAFADDSLPMTFLHKPENHHLLRRLGEKLTNRIACMVIEHQDNNKLGAFYLRKSQRVKQAAIKRHNIQLLTDTGLLRK